MAGDFLHRELPHRCVGRAGLDEVALLPRPPRSPDLTPCDFFLWGYVKDKANGHGGLVVWSVLRGRGFQIRNPIPLKIRRLWGLLHAKSHAVAKRPPFVWCTTPIPPRPTQMGLRPGKRTKGTGVVWNLGEGVPAHVSTSPSDCCSQLRGLSRYSPRVSSKQGINITKRSVFHNYYGILL
ncbi:hypothetical protein AVEN_258757-1 [Araneus ventricosus]|uniref:Uncharacterized protein n=1 Tax=Araneus ventricosus TaxID=182803 RepID=A0A4Y2D2F3_ARAVE|nr:hypothetical protein AVEN_258757-1 [Araneus ventricosus]